MLVILQFGVSMGDSLTSSQKFLFWGFIVLFIVLFIFFLYRTDKIITAQNQSLMQTVNPSHNNEMTDEEAAAIALAIHMYKIEMHDMESLTITLKKVSRIYSPWSSKIYTLRQNPR
jgi:energy-converting hydrogenase Eha subunit H